MKENKLRKLYIWFLKILLRKSNKINTKIYRILQNVENKYKKEAIENFRKFETINLRNKQYLVKDFYIKYKIN